MNSGIDCLMCDKRINRGFFVFNYEIRFICLKCANVTEKEI